MPTTSDLLAGGIISLLFLGLIAAAELWRRLANPQAEWTRKLVHVGGGVVCVLLPFVIASHWVVLGMSLAMVALFAISHGFGLLRSLHGVDRKSAGTEYYPLVIYALFFFTADEPWKYVICVLVLAISDALAALVGSRWGKIRYEVDGQWKSLEGSLAFLLVTFVIVLVPLLIWQDTTIAIPPTANCVLAAMLVAVLVTAFEAVALHGRDNLWVPLGTMVVLTKILRQDLAEIAAQNASLWLICLIVGWAAWRTWAFNVGGTIVFILAAYAAWSLGSFYWALPAFLGLAGYTMSLFFARHRETYKVRPVVRSLLTPFLILAAANVAFQFDAVDTFNFLFGPYLAGCIMVGVQRVWIQLRTDWLIGIWLRLIGVVATAVMGATLIAVPLWFFAPEVHVSSLLCLGVSTAITGVLHDRLIGERVPLWLNWRWHATRLSLTCVAMAMIAAMQAAGWSGVWNVWIGR